MSVLIFISGLLIGGLCGIVTMCLVQVNRYNSSGITSDTTEEKWEDQ